MIGMNKERIPTSEILNDDEIIARILHGEKDLYSIIVRRYNQRLYRVGMSMINDDAEVEDAMQVAYINAYENLGKFGFRSSFPTWLTRILINECLLRLRKRKKSISMNDENMENVVRQDNEPRTPVTATIVVTPTIGSCKREPATLALIKSTTSVGSSACSCGFW